MRSDSRTLLEHAHVEIGLELFQTYRACKTRRSCTDDDDVIGHDVAFDGQVTHDVERRITCSSVASLAAQALLRSVASRRRDRPPRRSTCARDQDVSLPLR